MRRAWPQRMSIKLSSSLPGQFWQSQDEAMLATKPQIAIKIADESEGKSPGIQSKLARKQCVEFERKKTFTHLKAATSDRPYRVRQ